MKNYLLIVGLLLMCGCATEPQYSPLPAEQPRPKLPPLDYGTNAINLMPPAPGEKQIALATKAKAQLTPTGPVPNAKKQLWLEWDWVPEGPVWFEVWHALTLNGFSWAGGTNAPTGFVLWTNVLASPVPIEGNQAQEYFLVRAANSAGVSDWAR